MFPSVSLLDWSFTCAFPVFHGSIGLAVMPVATVIMEMMSNIIKNERLRSAS